MSDSSLAEPPAIRIGASAEFSRAFTGAGVILLERSPIEFQTQPTSCEWELKWR